MPGLRALCAFLLATGIASAAGTVREFNFADDSGATGPGLVTYSQAQGHGFEPGADLTRVQPFGAPPGGGYVTSDRPFFFSVDLPEGNYRVTATLAGGPHGSIATIKAESRRVMLAALPIPANETRTVTFIVNTRTPALPDGGSVRLKPREIGALHWDHRLTLEFNGVRPALADLKVERADDVPTVFLAGDSTVTDQQLEPYAAWGQLLPQFFQPTLAIANHAESGESIKSFVSERRFERVLTLIRPGDYFFLQFGHNDQKQGSAHSDAGVAYQELVRRFVREIRAEGATPVLVTSMERRRFDATGQHIVPSLDGYPESVRALSTELAVPLIDLNRMSVLLYEALGPAASKHAFVHFPAGSFPGQDQALADDTHFSAYGAHELAQCIVGGIKLAVPALAQHLRPELEPYDPRHPTRFSDWQLPPSPPKPVVKPDGN